MYYLRIFTQTLLNTDFLKILALEHCYNNILFLYFRHDFQIIQAANKSLSEGYLEWNDNNWVTLIDGMIQLNILRQKQTGVTQLAQLRNLIIDIREHMSSDLIDCNGKPSIKVTVSDLFDSTR